MSLKVRPLIYKAETPAPPVPQFPSVQIGNKIWMSENLSIDDGGEGIYTIDSVIANGVEFGPQTYYTWDAAMRVANSIPGWHLPSLSEWEELYPYMDSEAKNVRSTSGWNSGSQGTNELGLNIIPVGRLESPDMYNVQVVGEESNLWTSDTTIYTDWCKAIFFYSSGYNNWGTEWNIYGGNSVRLIKD